MQTFIGTILPVAFNYPPRGWAFCNGQLLAIQQNTALFSLLGTFYGGNGTTNFALPDLRGRVPVGAQGNGPGVSPVQIGEKSGTNSVTVVANGTATVTVGAANMPAHAHAATGLTAATNVNVSTGVGGSVTPAAGSVLTGTNSGVPAAAAVYLPAATTPTAPVDLGGVTTTVAGTTASAGSGTPLNAPVSTSATMAVMQPYQGVNYIIATTGIFPSRN